MQTRADQTLFDRTAHEGGRYRGEIDGLRGIAVTLVVLFHLPTGRVQGGYVGVDVFFVLSGFLITGILMRDMERGTLSLTGFYERRLRRIAPALLAMLAATTAAAMLYLLPVDLVPYGRSLGAAVLSVSNFFFLKQEGYFQTATVWLLQHTWSLAVEEQFYLVFPPALLLLRRCFRTQGPEAWRRLVAMALGVASAASLALAVWMVPRDSVGAFYLPWTRAWELLTGSLLAVVPLRLRLPSWLRSAVAACGVGAIVWCAHAYMPSTPFPGLAALPACLGTAAVIAMCDEPTPMKRLLSVAPLRWAGLISYSVYLWHWPLLMLYRLGVVPGLARHSEGFAKVMLLAASYALGYVSWRLVEQPFRRRGAGKVPVRWLSYSTGAVALLLLGVAASCVMTGGLPSRYSARAVALAAYQGRVEDFGGRCFVMTGESMDRFDRAGCLSTQPERRNYLLTGDSHAAALHYGLTRAFPEVHFLEATASACDPLPEVIADPRCGGMRQLVYHQFLAGHPPIDGVILSMRLVMDHGGYPVATQAVDRLETTVTLLKRLGIPVILIGPVQEYSTPLPVLLAYADARSDAGLPAQHAMDGYAALDQYMRTKAALWGVQYVSIRDVQCPQERCRTFADAAQTVPTLEDSHHLTNAASLAFLQQLRDTGSLRLDR